MKIRILLVLALSLLATDLEAQVGDVDAPERIALTIPTLVESSACPADASAARAVLDRAARYDDDAALDYLEAVRDSLEPTVESGLESGSSIDTETLFVLAAVRGVEATLEGGMTQVKAAEAAFRLSRRVLDLEPGHAGAAYVLGRLNAGVMRTSGFTRFLARTLMGAEALGDASWDDARRLLEIAVEARPCDPEYRYELGRVYADMGSKDLAMEQLDVAAGSGERGPRARAARDGARALMDRLRAETAGS